MNYLLTGAKKNLQNRTEYVFMYLMKKQERRVK